MQTLARLDCQRRYSSFTTSAAALFSAAVMFSSCVAPGPLAHRNVSLHLHDTGSIEYNGRLRTAEQTARHLRRQGLEADAVIQVKSASAGASRDDINRLIRALRKAGYTRVVLVGERHIETQTNNSSSGDDQ